MILHIMDYDKLVAKVELVDGKIVVKPVGGNAWVADLVEDMRRRVVLGRGIVTLSDAELYHSLRERLAGSLWAGEPRAKPLASDDMESKRCPMFSSSFWCQRNC